MANDEQAFTGTSFATSSCCVAIRGTIFRTGRERSQITCCQLTSDMDTSGFGHGPVERIFAVMLGYIVVAILLAVYLNILTVSSVRSFGKAVRNVVRQQLLILKVCLSSIMTHEVF
jgi:E3 ubiquitin-protein ligase MARCH6